MTANAQIAASLGTAEVERRAALSPFLATAWRYSLSAGGPIAISAAHFAASLIFLHGLSPADFGLFSFLLIVVPFCLSASGALVGMPASFAVTHSASMPQDALPVCRRMNLIFSALAGLGVSALLLLSRADLSVALFLGLYGAAMAMRWFLRNIAFAQARTARAVASDFVYSGVVVGGLAALVLSHALTPLGAAAVLAAAACCSLPPTGLEELRRQFLPPAGGSLLAYRIIWRDLTQWTLLGVVLTEITANAHAYFVTFISGPKAFALLALGALLMRPASLVLTALQDVERPLMARAIAKGDSGRALRSVNEFGMAAGAIWLATIVLSGVLLFWFPHLILKKGYDPTQALIVVALWAVIMAVRVLRTPQAVLLQAAGAFNPLARVGFKSSATSIVATLVLLVVAGPVASLGGILAGDVVMTVDIFSLTRRWKRDHV